MATAGIATGAGRGMGSECARALPGLVEQMTPLRREGRAEEVAKVVAFALSDDASFLNGVDLLVDGGIVAAIAAMERG